MQTEIGLANEQTAEAGVSTRGFWSLIVVQFQVAFSDNTLRFLVTFMGLGLGLWAGKPESFVPLVGALFAAPFLLFSLTGGYFADRYSKRSTTIAMKLFEIAITLLAFVGLVRHDMTILLCSVFLMGMQSALFGPSKYGLLPELLPKSRLSWGNGYLEMGTFLAIIAGGAAGGWLFETFKARQQFSGFIFLALALAGLAVSTAITRVPAANPGKRFQWNLFADLASKIGLIRRDRILWLAVLGNIYFSFLGMLVQQNIVLYGTHTLGVGELRTSYLMAALAIGIGIGSFAAGYLSHGKIEYGLVPLGALGMTVFSIMLSRPDASFSSAFVELALLGFSGGFFIVPISALMQHRPESGERGGVLAAANWLSFAGIFSAAGVYYAITSLAGFKPPAIFLFGGLATLIGTVYVLWLLPDALLRLVFWMLTNTVYRIHVEGRENIPAKGGALLVCNHLSMVDGMLLIASTDRFIRFLMFKGSYDHWLVKPFARAMRVIPISSHFSPREMIRSLREATETIRNGDVAAIFPEGQMTRIGQMMPFRRGFERIMKGTDAPIIPVALDGVWGSIFSFEKGRFVWKLPHRIPYPVTVSFGKPMPSSATAMEVRQAVQDLQSQAFAQRKKRMKTLDRSIIRSARRNAFHFAMADGRTPRLTFGSALTRAVFLARRLRKHWDGQKMVGILLPPSVAGALVNHAALLLGKVPVNLNYTASNEIIASCAKQCELQTVITAKAFLERVPIRVPGRTILIEELAANPTPLEKIASFLIAWFCPDFLMGRALGADRQPTLDDLATVIFSSGSTGDPKGVMLTHYNLAANVEQLVQVFAPDYRDRILGILPFFHSFGFTAGLLLPAIAGVGVVFHPNPLEPQAISALVGRYAVTFMIGTPTFLQGYIRRCSPEDFGSLRYVLVGAEKLPDRLAQAFEDRFGIQPLEGYGCTECAPAVAVNRPDFRAPGFRQVGAKRGTIGHPLPGVSVRIVDPETMVPVPMGQPGLLLVKGPNVMAGYLGRPDKTAEVLHDGWYTTGDIATLDDDGFLTITDRLSRFSKIGGEMVPHVKIEAVLHELAGATEQCFAVTAIPDGKKGERLIVLHTLTDEKLKDILPSLSRADLPNLWKPRPDQFFHIDKLPYLGTGKLDLRRLREYALELSKQSTPA